MAVQFVDAATGWVVTGDGVIGTTDGGAHWRGMLSRRVRSAAQLDFIDREHGWVVADGTLLTTVNGGRTWTSLPGPCPQLSKVHFYDTVDGYAVTGATRRDGTWRSGLLLRTEDGGRSWTRVESPPQPQDVCFPDTSDGWLAASGEIYRTVDGARSWTLVEAGPRYRHRHGLTSWAAVQCSGTDDAWAVITGGAGMSQQAHTAYHLHDLASFPIYTERFFPHPGVHTEVSSPGSYAGPFTAVSPTTAVFIDYCPACGAGTAPTAVTLDSGRSILRRPDIPGLSDATGASFVTGAQGWTIGVQQLWRNNHHVGARYKILHTNDDAEHWHTQHQVTLYSNS